MSWLDVLVVGILGLFALCSLVGLWLFVKELKRYFVLRSQVKAAQDQANDEDD